MRATNLLVLKKMQDKIFLASVQKMCCAQQKNTAIVLL